MENNSNNESIYLSVYATMFQNNEYFFAIGVTFGHNSYKLFTL